MFYGSNPFRKDNPRRAISNATETPKVPDLALQVLWDAQRSPLDRLRRTGAISAAWLTGLPRRAGARLYAMNDAEARWWRWHVSEHHGGLVHQYRDARFADLPDNPVLRREGLDLDPAPAQPA